jgi:ADP-ribose pyrophosphatase YjhB (NUDIX family)
MNFCSHCGRPVELRVPAGDNLPRYVCPACHTIHYQNPKLVVGCVAAHAGRILLCKRAIEPRLGYWTVPAGFMELGETLQAAAARESQEEALAAVEIGSLLAVVNVVHAHQVHVMFRALLPRPDYGAGHESLAAALYSPAEIPWSEIAFPSVEFALRRYLADEARGVRELHFADFDRPAWKRATPGA